MILVLILHVVYCTHLSTKVFSLALLLCRLHANVLCVCVCGLFAFNMPNAVRSNEFVTNTIQTLRCQPHLMASPTPPSSSPLPLPKTSKCKTEFTCMLGVGTYLSFPVLLHNAQTRLDATCESVYEQSNTLCAVYHSILICSNEKPTTFIAPPLSTQATRQTTHTHIATSSCDAHLLNPWVIAITK